MKNELVDTRPHLIRPHMLQTTCPDISESCYVLLLLASLFVCVILQVVYNKLIIAFTIACCGVSAVLFRWLMCIY